jgi:DNA polymerase-3 subunit epsilon
VELTDDEAHGAAADAIAAGRIALVLTADRRLAGIPGPVLRRKQKAWSREQRTSFIAYRRANGDPDFTTDKNWPLYLSALALTVPEPTFVF